MRKRLIILLVTLGMAALSWMVIAPASSQAQPPPTVCNGTYWGGTFNNLVVPSWDSCVLVNSRVHGTITANPNSSLRTCAATIKGSVDSTQGYVNMDNYTEVDGSVDLNQPGTTLASGGSDSCSPEGEPSGYAAYICPRLIGGSLNITNGPDSGLDVYVGDCGSVNIHGSVRITGNRLYVEVEDAHILGSLTCLNNWPLPDVWDTTVVGPTHGTCYGNSCT
ncbi:MAG TPA: hypothetical protein VGN35_06315 [Jatrophihabitantaceae bacterium]|jgi:hypothetical protein|nr:hypothetical protein [Jatrophihabitantaceae bacterium]